LRIIFAKDIIRGVNEKRYVMKRLYILLVVGLLSFNAIAEENSWTGFYVGGNLGYANAYSDSKVALGGQWSTQPQFYQQYFINNSQNKQNPSGGSFGFQAGYDYQFENNLVLGIEIDYSELDIDESRQTPLLDDGGGPADVAFSNKVEVNHNFSLRPKLGFAYGDTVAFISAGAAWTSVEFSSAAINQFGNYDRLGKKSKTLTSLIWGVGVEHKFLDNISAKLEYLRVSRDDASYDYVDGPGDIFAYTEKFKVDLDYDMIRAGINYRF
jgi:outer membrane immunogenic protein